MRHFLFFFFKNLKFTFIQLRFTVVVLSRLLFSKPLETFYKICTDFSLAMVSIWWSQKLNTTTVYTRIWTLHLHIRKCSCHIRSYAGKYPVGFYKAVYYKCFINNDTIVDIIMLIDHGTHIPCIHKTIQMIWIAFQVLMPYHMVFYVYDCGQW